MAYIELHQAVFTHRKTIKLAGRLGIPRLYAVAHLSALWTWALDNAPDGNLTELEPEVIAFGAGWEGEASSFVGALSYAGWIDSAGNTADDGYTIHDWDEYGGKLFAIRQAGAERVRRHRERQPSVTNADVTVTNADVTVTRPLHGGEIRGEESRGEEPRGEETSAYASGSTSPPPPSDAGVESNQRDASASTPTPTNPELEKVLIHHRDATGRKQRYKPNPTELRLLTKAVSEFGADALCESIDYMASKGVTDLSKARTAAYTHQGGRNGATRGRMGSGGDDIRPSYRAGAGQATQGNSGALSPGKFAYYVRPNPPSGDAQQQARAVSNGSTGD